MISKGVRFSPQSVLQSSTPVSATWLLHFQDARPPQEIQFQLERALMTLMPPGIEEGKLACRANAKITGAQYSFLLTYQAALPKTNCYSLRVQASWAHMAPMHHDYFRKTSGSWFELWTRDFQRASPPSANEHSAERYRQVCEAALNAEAGLNSIEEIQQAIVAAMKHGASFATAHKEGGTNIRWHNGRFVRSDYGESEERNEFASEQEFLKFLRQFYDWETSRNVYPNKVSDFEAWKLILRMLRK
jgi:hypothetical protein